MAIEKNTSWTAGVWEAGDIKRGMVVRLKAGTAKILQVSLDDTDDIDEWRLVSSTCVHPQPFSKAELIDYLNEGRFLRVG